MKYMTILSLIYRLFSFTTLLIAVSCQNATQLKISQNGQTEYKVVLPANPHDLEVKAANELRKYLKQISNAEFQIIREGEPLEKGIYVGQTKKAGTVPQNESEVSYFMEDGNLILVGGSPQSTLYTVYTFLDQELGCRFYSPNVEKIPSTEALLMEASTNFSYIPPISIRTVHSRLFYDNPEFADKHKVTKEAFPQYVSTARVHTFHRFAPEEKYYQDHPEYYALRSGKRIPTQLCLTNEAVFEIVRDTVAALLKAYPEAKVISVSQDDNTQYCQCEHCETIHQREASPSGSMIEFVNRIAREFPDKQISTLAYQYTRKAPENLIPESNVLITLCSIECDRSGPIAEKCEDFTEDLVAWGKITDNIRIWDYTTQFTNFLAPFPNLYTLKPNIELFEKNQAKWVFEQHSFHPSELFELRSYLTAKLLWNPKSNPETIISEFLQGYYEEAAPFIQTYISTIHRELQQDSAFFLFLYGDPSQGFESFLSDSLLSFYDSLYTEAAIAVSEKPAVSDRVQTARLSIDYALLEYAKRNLGAIINGPIENGQTSIIERLDRFAETCTKANVTLMNEMRYSVEDYIELYQKTVDRAAQPNLAQSKPVQLLSQPKKYANEDPQTLTDGAFGSSSFYANWLGFEGNHLEVIIDLEKPVAIKEISLGFLQVSNHIVFFPEEVQYSGSLEGENYQTIGTVTNQSLLTKDSPINDIQYYTCKGNSNTFRYLKIFGKNRKVAPIWHNAAGLPAWIFADEIEVR